MEFLIKIDNEADREEVARILFKNGYTVRKHRKKSGKKYEYFVSYNGDSMEDENE